MLRQPVLFYAGAIGMFPRLQVHERHLQGYVIFALVEDQTMIMKMCSLYRNVHFLFLLSVVYVVDLIISSIYEL